MSESYVASLDDLCHVLAYAGCVCHITDSVCMLAYREKMHGERGRLLK